MTNDTNVPEWIWLLPEDVEEFKDTHHAEGAVCFVPHDHAQALVAAENQACFDACAGEYLEDEPETEEDKAYDRAVADCLLAIQSRTPTDAQAALEARDQRVREEALRDVLGKEDGCGFVSREDILALIEGDTDE